MAPRDLKVVNVMADNMTIKWKKPEEDGGSPITGMIEHYKQTQLKLNY